MEYVGVQSRNGRDAHAVSVHGFTHRWGLKTHADRQIMMISNVMILVMGGVLSQISRKIYENGHNPSLRTLKRHMCMAAIPKKRFREIKNVARGGKKEYSKQERSFGGGSENNNRKYIHRTSWDGFCRFWGFRNISSNTGYFLTFRGNHFYGREKRKEEQTPEMVSGNAISIWPSALGGRLGSYW